MERSVDEVRVSSGTHHHINASFLISPSPVARGSPSSLCQARHLQRIGGPVVPVAVVEDDVNLLRLASNFLDLRHPLLELLPAVEISKAFDDGDATLLP